MTNSVPLYPSISPHHVGRLAVSDDHDLYFAEFGNTAGIPVLFLHGGPGSGCNPVHARLFHPDRYRVIQVDQRGAGRSSPQGRLHGNNLSALVGDLVSLRKKLEIRKWLVHGGSWGGTLALEYAKVEPHSVSTLVLRAPFLARREDMDWFAGSAGIAKSLPNAYGDLRRALSLADDDSPITRLFELMCHNETVTESSYLAALTWDRWEAAVMGLPAPSYESDSHPRASRFNRKRIHIHYCHHQFFLGAQGVMNGLSVLKKLKTFIVHGTKDQVCRYSGSEQLAEHFTRCGLLPIAEAGHSQSAFPMQSKLRELFDGLSLQ